MSRREVRISLVRLMDLPIMNELVLSTFKIISTIIISLHSHWPWLMMMVRIWDEST